MLPLDRECRPSCPVLRGRPQRVKIVIFCSGRTHRFPDQEGTGSVRFVSVPDFSKIVRFGSVRFGNLVFPVRRGSACGFQTRRGSVRFDSVPRPVPAGFRIIQFGQVRPVRFGFLFIPADCYFFLFLIPSYSLLLLLLFLLISSYYYSFLFLAPHCPELALPWLT